MSSCESDCICCCLPCVVGWACIYFTYSGVRGIGRYCYNKCHPKPSTSKSQGRADDAEKHGSSQGSSQLGPEIQQYSRSMKHRSQDVASSITQIQELQEPEKAYYAETIKTQPSPKNQMSMNLPPNIKMHYAGGDRRSSVQTENSNRIISVPSPTLSVHDTLSSRHESDTVAHVTHTNDSGEPQIVYPTVPVQSTSPPNC
ncbi:hypothetical protein DFP72DRAFT_622063 [Ephemerocybe angulata]|uniref:Uncharacterized protein n=1 Tax=Ephemerocybe angulata TaxID=980116 RepID=A0A8H6HHB0_9AGAR|nr:hypothetical protein DFP72DRAFT_622063 [Tulosesus angulatus]